MTKKSTKKCKQLTIEIPAPKFEIFQLCCLTWCGKNMITATVSRSYNPDLKQWFYLLGGIMGIFAESDLSSKD